MLQYLYPTVQWLQVEYTAKNLQSVSDLFVKNSNNMKSQAIWLIVFDWKITWAGNTATVEIFSAVCTFGVGMQAVA